MLDLRLFAISFAFRLLNAQLNASFFQPDEYFQAWEPAYAQIHGRGFVAWEWQAQIRTSLMPRLCGHVIQIAQYWDIDHLELGKWLMAGLASVGDVGTAKLAERVLPGQSGTAAFYVSLGSFFNWYVSTRPFSNTVEMVLVVLGLNLWLSGRWLGLVLAQLLAQLAIALRPSNAIFWLVFGLYQLKIVRWRQKIVVGGTSLVMAVVVQGAIIWLDRGFYESLGHVDLKIPVVEFLKQNFGSRVSEIYGVMPWHWYFSQGVPFLLLGYLPLAVAGFKYVPRKLVAFVVLNLVAFSLVKHKEFRFIYFLLPLLHITVAQGFRVVTWRWLKIVGVGVNLVVAIYFSMFHQRGAMSIVEHIRAHPEITEVSFLMPCHSTPWQAHFQRPEPAFKPQFLTCDPPWNRSSVGYVDEADQFYLDPPGFLRAHPDKLAPHVAIFEPLLPLMEDLGYEEEHRFGNGLFNEDARRRGEVLLMHRV